ncbi:MAG TPA: DNA polymerase IV, partial [Bacillota bacterium]|nr:DNA polymerase IV [Bacillota bacterium]
ISRENFKSVIFPLPASELLFVGPAVEAQLKKMCINTIGDLADADRAMLKKRLGKTGLVLHNYANGYECDPVSVQNAQSGVKSVSNGYTFLHDVTSPAELRTASVALADEVAARMRGYGVKGRTVKVFLRTCELKVSGMQKTLDVPTNLSCDIARSAYELINMIDIYSMPVRSMTVAVSNLIGKENCFFRQISMLSPDMAFPNKREVLEETVDTIRARFGRSSVMPASLLKNTLGFDVEEEKQSCFRSVTIR